MSKFNITIYENEWEGLIPPGSNLTKEKLAGLEKYLTFDKKQSMSRYEVRLYEWILKKQYKATPVELHTLIEENLVGGYAHYHRFYYLGYYIPVRNPAPDQEYEYAKEQKKNRARYYSKMGR